MPELRDGALGQGCALPLTPGPSSLPGARGATSAFNTTKNKKSSPRPQRGRGAGGEAAKHPKTPHRSTPTKPPRGCHANQPLTSVISVPLWLKTRLTRDLPDRSRAKARATKRGPGRGQITPHPRPLSPSRGEGCHSAFNTTKNSKSSPRPQRGRGAGGEGETHPKTPRRSTPKRPHSAAMHIYRSPLWPLW